MPHWVKKKLELFFLNWCKNKLTAKFLLAKRRGEELG